MGAHKINDFLQVGYDLIHPALAVKSEFQNVTINGREDRILLLTVKSSDKQVFSNSKDEVYLRIGDDIRIIMYADRINIHSPGDLPSIVTVDNIRTTHYSRNPSIARAIVQFGWVREFGEGVDRMYKNMEEYFLDDPEYVATNAYTELTLRNNIVMRNSRRKEKIGRIIDYDLANLNYPGRAALI